MKPYTENISLTVSGLKKFPNTTAVIAITKDTRAVYSAEIYAKTSEKMAAQDMVNSIYWNCQPASLGTHLGEWNGTYIVNKLKFIILQTDEEKDLFIRLFNDLHFSLTHLDEKISAKNATAIENLFFKQAKDYKECTK